MDVSQFLLALRARRKAFLLVLVATIVMAIGVALVVPKKYVGTATLLVDSRDEQALTPARVLTFRDRASYIGTQIELIQSGRVAQQVVRDLKLNQNPELRAAFEEDTGGVGSIDAWIAEILLAKLKVTSSVSNLITVEYSSNDPKRSADVANAFAKAYLATALDLRTQPQREAAEWFEDQLKGMKARVTEAQGKLTDYQRQKGLITADDRVDIDAARLGEL
ncbi:MAG TPA: Wzz/FepE/Etk N-terminal domain-containing protein, partial [Candidatus Limnocylindrales bacterium]